jgi:hypothetical protein
MLTIALYEAFVNFADTGSREIGYILDTLNSASTETKLMARQKRTSTILEKAERRAAGLKALEVDLDFGNSRSLTSFVAAIEQMRKKQEQYNQLLASIDATYVEMLEFEKALADLSDHMLLGVASRFGRNSSEYEAAGGVRKSEQVRRRYRSKAKAESEATKP